MLTLVWDIDDVLNDLMQTWFVREWLPAHSECTLQYSDLHENPPHRVLGVSKAEYLQSLDRFNLSGGARLMEPNTAILDWLDRYGRGHRHIALTARPLESTPYLAEWLFRNFGAYFRNFAVVPVRLGDGVPRYDADKRDFLEWLGRADLLVDDSEENIGFARSLGIRNVLYPRPWNRNSATVAETLLNLTALAEAN